MNLKKIKRESIKNVVRQPAVGILLILLILTVIIGIVLAVSRLISTNDNSDSIDVLSVNSSLIEADDSANLDKVETSGGSSLLASMSDVQSGFNEASAMSSILSSEPVSIAVSSRPNFLSELSDPVAPYTPGIDSSEAGEEDAYLKSLKLSSGSLSPDFMGIEYEYKATVKNSVKSIDVETETSNSEAVVKISGGEELEVGSNKIKITVTSKSGDTVKTYVINVTRKEAEKKSSGHTGKSSSSPVSELKAPDIELDENNQPVHYKELITGKATAYYNPNGNKLATGKSFKPGYVAVNPKQIPYGTKMYIVSPKGGFVYGYAIAADTGGFATNGSGTVVDLAFWTRDEVYNFGRRTMNIYILE